jgi:ketosteroid isomerase-like protein
MSGADTARAFIDAFNARDLDAFAATLHPEVEIHGGRGLRRGIDAARDWARRSRRGIQQQILVEDVREAGDRVVALIVREWRWGEDEEETGAEPAHADIMAWLFELRGGKIVSWRAFDDRDAALAALDAAD